MLITGEYAALNNNCIIKDCGNCVDVLCKECDCILILIIAIFCIAHATEMHQNFNKFHIWNKLKRRKNFVYKIDYDYVWDARIINSAIRCRNEDINNSEELNIKVVTLYGILKIKFKKFKCPCHDMFKSLILNNLFPATPVNISINNNVR